MHKNDKTHWDKVYSRNTDQDVGWYQEYPATSLALIRKYSDDKKSSIIDIGAGNSNLTNELLKSGYHELSVLDISAYALDRSRSKIITGSEKISFIEASVLELKLEKRFNLWHDRAVFHFIWDVIEISKYVEKVAEHLKDEGIFILGAFSEQGPEKCSALPVNRQTEKSIQSTFGKHFVIIESFIEDHITPSGKTQNYIFSVLKKK